MAKICITERTPDKTCSKCEHYKYDVDYGEKCCYAVPNERGEVEWMPAVEKPKENYIPLYRLVANKER